MARLICTDAAGGRREIEVGGKRMRIGRTSENEIVLPGSFVSRSHAVLLRTDDGTVLIRDLGSHNGTFVNGVQVRERRLARGDVVKIGGSALEFVEEEAEAPRAARVEDRTVVVGELQLSDGRLIKALSGAAAAPIGELATKADRTSAEGAEVSKSLLLLYRVSEKLNQSRNLQELLETVVDVSIEATGAERGFLFLAGGVEAGGPERPDGRLVPMVERDPSAGGARAEVRGISTTIARRVVRDRVALITKDTELDPELVGADSIALLNIRSALCVPLWSGAEVIGILYLDSTHAPHPFSSFHLDLLTAIGYQAATGIERTRYAERMRMEEELRRSLSRFHSPDVVEMIAAGGRDGGESLGPRELEATVLFCDICGFTKAAENMPPFEVAGMLSGYFGAMTEIIFRHRGTLDKYIGDGIMAVFGAPFSYGDDARRAVSAAIEMVAAAAGLDCGVEGRRGLGIRIGINTGRVVAGSIGTAEHMDYTVLGDAVNVAARLEAESDPGGILIGESTKELVSADFECIFAGERKVKGRQGPVRAWRVAGRMTNDE